MKATIEKMTEKDRESVREMMRTFYASPAVLSNGSEEIFENDINYCVGDSPYLEGYVFRDKQEVLGYAMAAKSFSTEFGKPCVWIEDLYIKSEHRGEGLGGQFLKFIEEKYADCVLRLEAEGDNERALGVYKKHGYEILPYTELIKRKKTN